MSVLLDDRTVSNYDYFFANYIQSDGDFLVAGNSSISGNATVSGDSQFNGAVAVAEGKQTTLGGFLQVNHSADITGTLGVTGVVTLQNDLNAQYGSSRLGNVTVNGGLSTIGTADLGDVQVRNNKSTILGGTLRVKQAATLDTTLDVTGALTVEDGSATVLGGTLQAKGDTQLDGSLTVADGKQTTLNGYLLVNSTAGITGSLSVVETLTAQGVATFGSTVNANGLLNVLGDASFSSALTVADSKVTTLGGTLEVKSGATFDSDVSVEGASSIHDLTVADGSDAVLGGDLHTKGNTQLDGTLTVALGKTTTLNGMLYVNNNAFLNEGVVVGDGTESILGGAVTAKGGVQMNSTLSVAGASSIHALTVADGSDTVLGNDLTVKGQSNLQGDLIVSDSKSTTLGGALRVKGDAQLDSALSVDGALTLNNSLTVSEGSSTSLGGSLNVSGPADLADNLLVHGTTELQQAVQVGQNVDFVSTGTVPSPQADRAVIYFDDATKKLKVSEAGGLFVELIGPKGITGTVTSSNSTAATLLSYTLPNESSVTLTATVTGRKVGTTVTNGYNFIGTFYKAADGTVTQQGRSITIFSAAGYNQGSAVFFINGGAVEVRVTGDASDWKWSGIIQFQTVVM